MIYCKFKEVYEFSISDSTETDNLLRMKEEIVEKLKSRGLHVKVEQNTLSAVVTGELKGLGLADVSEGSTKVVEYKGYLVSQASNNHVAIFQDGKMLFHAIKEEKLSDEELKEYVDFYLNLVSEL